MRARSENGQSSNKKKKCNKKYTSQLRKAHAEKKAKHNLVLKCEMQISDAKPALK